MLAGIDTDTVQAASENTGAALASRRVMLTVTVMPFTSEMRMAALTVDPSKRLGYRDTLDGLPSQTAQGR